MICLLRNGRGAAHISQGNLETGEISCCARERGRGLAVPRELQKKTSGNQVANSTLVTGQKA